MKVRAGFVSNSSTSSFCFYGIYEDSYSLIEKLIKNGIIDEEVDESDYYDIIEEIAGKNGLDFDSDSNGSFVVGGDLAQIPDDVVVKEWKSEIQKKINKLFGKDSQCDIYEESFHD